RDIVKQGNLDKIWDDFAPEGRVNATLTIRRQKDGWRKLCTIEPLEINVVPHCFPFPVDHVTGAIEHLAGAGLRDECRLNLVANAGGRPAYLRGTVKGVAPHHDVDATIEGDNLTM